MSTSFGRREQTQGATIAARDPLAPGLFFTEIVEAPIYVYGPLREQRRFSAFCRALVASAITHPVVWFVWPILLPDDYMLMLVSAEAFAVLVEAMYLHQIGGKGALYWSVIANLASLGSGMMLRGLFGWP